MSGGRGWTGTRGDRGRRPRRRSRTVASAPTALAVLALAVGAAPASADTTTVTATLPVYCPVAQYIVVPTSQTVTAGQSATFGADYPDTCTVPPSPIGTAYWEVSTDGGLTFAPVAGSYSTLLSTGRAATSLTVPDTSVAMSGDEYEAVFTYLTGATTVTPPATLTVLPGGTSTSTSTSPPTSTSATSTSTSTSTSSASTTTSTSTSTTTSATPPFAPPVVTGIAPSSGPSRSVVLIQGIGLGRARAVMFGSQRALFLGLGSRLIVALAPPAPAGRVDVTVTTPGGTSAVSSADGFTYLN